MSEEPKEPVRAIVVLYDGEAVESLWVQHIAGSRYEVCVIPYFAYNLSLGDEVECGPDEDGSGLFVERVLSKAGNRTVRVGFQSAEGGLHDEAKRLRVYLNEQEIDFDYDDAALISINVASDDVYERLQQRLETIPSDAQMIWEDGDPQPQRLMDGSEVEVDDG